MLLQSLKLFIEKCYVGLLGQCIRVYMSYRLFFSCSRANILIISSVYQGLSFSQIFSIVGESDPLHFLEIHFPCLQTDTCYIKYQRLRSRAVTVSLSLPAAIDSIHNSKGELQPVMSCKGGESNDCFAFGGAHTFNCVEE
ncbi:hypothetical protein VNO77_25460 [Canavalia gladiata]|uniref:Uncharacterized protein n=1 Tax=Canavalia gladiata TaxID=3824 RepID=A0AAN9L9H5_CANGL